MRSIILFVMLWLIFLGRITLGEFLSLWFYSFYIFSPLGDIGTVTSQYQEAKGSLEKLEEILAIPSEIKPVNAVRIDGLKAVEFRDVSFGYQSNGTLAVKDINAIYLERGDCCVRGLLRFREDDPGQIAGWPLGRAAGRYS